MGSKREDYRRHVRGFEPLKVPIAVFARSDKVAIYNKVSYQLAGSTAIRPNLLVSKERGGTMQHNKRFRLTHVLTRYRF